MNLGLLEDRVFVLEQRSNVLPLNHADDAQPSTIRYFNQSILSSPDSDFFRL